MFGGKRGVGHHVEVVVGASANVERHCGDVFVEEQRVAVVGLEHVSAVVEPKVDDHADCLVVVHELVDGLVPLFADLVLVLPVPGGNVDVADLRAVDHTPCDVVLVDEVGHLDAGDRQLLVAPDRSRLTQEQIGRQAGDFFAAILLNVDGVEEVPVHAGADEHRVLHRQIGAAPDPLQPNRKLGRQ